MATKFICPNGHTFKAEIRSAGWAGETFRYCNQCSNVVLISLYDPVFQILIKNKEYTGPGSWKEVEDALKSCPCGGKFTWEAKPRCPVCSIPVPTLFDKYAIIGKAVGPDGIWKEPYKKLRSPTKLANSGLFLAKFQWLVPSFKRFR